MTRLSAWIAIGFLGTLPAFGARIDRSGSDYGQPLAGPLASCVAPSGGGTFGYVSIDCGSTADTSLSRPADLVFTITLWPHSSGSVESVTFKFPNDVPQDFGLVVCPVDATVPCTPPNTVQLLTTSLNINSELGTLAFGNFKLPNSKATVYFGFDQFGDPDNQIASVDSVVVAAVPEASTMGLSGAGIAICLAAAALSRTRH